MISKDVDLVKFFLDHRTEQMNINQIAKELNKDYKQVYTSIMRLMDKNIVKLERFGRAHKVQLCQRINPLLFEAEYLRREEALKNKDLAVMTEYFAGMNSTSHILLLFGSVAKKTSTKASDIDLLFVVPNNIVKEQEREIFNIAETIPLQLHIHIISETDFKDMRDSKKITVGSEAMKRNIILHNIEAYYSLQ